MSGITMGALELARGEVINRIQLTEHDYAEQNVSFLIRRLARVEILSRAYKVDFFGRKYTDANRYTPYLLEPPDSCCIAVRLGHSIFLTCQHFETLNPYSQAIIRSLADCDVSRPMFGPFEPTAAAGGSKLAFASSPDGQYIQRTLEILHEALYHLAVLIECAEVKGSEGSLRAPSGAYLEVQPLFDIFGQTPGVDNSGNNGARSLLSAPMNPFASNKRAKVAGYIANLAQYIKQQAIDIYENNEYVGLNAYSWWTAPWGSRGAAIGQQGPPALIPDQCVTIWVGSAGSTSEGLERASGGLLTPISDVEKLRERISGIVNVNVSPLPYAPVSTSPGAYDRIYSLSRQAIGMEQPGDLTLPLRKLAKVIYVRILIVRNDLVLEHSGRVKHMTDNHWHLLSQLSQLGPDDRAIADARGLFGEFMAWRREQFLQAPIPFNAPPQNTAYFVFCF
jgi:hypothetical protein